MITDSVVVDVSQDWAVACDLQERFMEGPCVKTQSLTYSARCRQMRAFGGDCFTLLPLPGHRLALAVADASGKGLPAALLIANVQSSLRTAALFAPDDFAAVVGFFAETVYEARTVQLNPGDLIVAYTDGIVETTNTPGEEWGVLGLVAAVSCCQMRQPDGILQAAFAALDEFSGDNQTDDATILAALVN